MAKKKAGTVAAAPASVAAAMSAKEVALSEFARHTAGVVQLCFQLAADANLSPDQQNLFWELGNRAVQLMVIINDQWTFLLERSPPTTADLRNASGWMQQATTALSEAGNNPLPQNLFTAATQTSSALDMAETMIELLG